MIDIKLIKENPEEIIRRFAVKGKDAREEITKILEQRVQSIIGHTVKIVQNGKKSSINIGFSDNDDLERILCLLCGDKYKDEL